MIRSHALAALLPLVFVSAAAAQTPQPPPEGPEKPAASAFHGTFSGGIQLQQGEIDAWGGTLDGNVTHAYSDRGQFVARTNVNYARVVVSRDPRVVKTQNDRETAAAGVDHGFSKYGVFMERSLYLRDAVHDLTYRFEQLAGVGIQRSARAGRVKYALVPGISVLKEDSFLADALERGWQAGAGFYQQLSVQVDPRWGVQDTFSYRRTFKYAEHSIETAASLTGKINRVMGLQVEYQYVREDLVPPGVNPNQQILTLGLQVSF